MVNAVSNASAPYAVTSSVQQQQKAPTPQPQAADSVQLSPAAQAVAMLHSGMQVKAIAATMGITTQAVDTYLGLTAGGSGGGGNPLSQLQSVAAHTKVLGPSKT